MQHPLVRRIFVGVISGLMSLVFVWLLTEVLFPRFFYRFESATYDLRTTLNWRLSLPDDPRKHKPIEDIVIIDIDEFSLQRLGKFHTWPRTYWAKAIRILNNGGARLIGMDLIFDPDPRRPEEDQAFLDALQQASNVITAFYLTAADSENFLYAMPSEPEGFQYQRFQVSLPPRLFYALPSAERMDPVFIELFNASRGVGFVNIQPDPDGVSRWITPFMRFNDRAYPAFAVKLAMEAAGITRIAYTPHNSQLQFFKDKQLIWQVPVTAEGRFLIAYKGPFKTFRYVSFYNLIMQRLDPRFFQGKIVLFGSSAAGLFDLRATPLQNRFPGVEVNANIIYQMLNHHFITPLGQRQRALFYVFIAFIMGLMVVFFRPLGGILATAVAVLLLFFGTFYALANWQVWLPLVAPMLILILTFSANYAYRFVIEERDKREIRRAFSHYLSPAVVDNLLQDTSKIKLGGEKKICTVMFSDLAGFTTFSEKMDPEELVKILNTYLTEMTNIIFDNDGMLDKYEGDAIMAVFGAPVDIGNHALKACRAALHMQRRLHLMRKAWEQRGWPALHQRIGINTGEMLVGNMGSETRFDYTVLGDAVNLGARLEGANKLYGTGILIGEQTYQMAQEGIYARIIDLLRVKGKSQPVKVYELIGLKEEPLSIEQQEIIQYFEKGYQHYLDQNWDWAMNQFRQVLQINPDDGPARLYLMRCQEFIQHPPPRNWDGVFTLKSK